MAQTILTESEIKRREMVQKAKLGGYEKKYGTWFKALHESKLAKFRPINDFDMLTLGDWFQSFETVKQICESAGTIDSLGRLPLIAFDLLTYTYGTSPLALATAVQQVDEPNGGIFYKGVYSAVTKGDVNKGDLLISANKSPDYYTKFASAKNSQVITTTAATAYEVTVGTELYENKISIITNIGTDNNIVYGKDDGYGHIIGYGLSGTVDYTTGKIDITLTAAPTAGQTITVYWEENVEATGNTAKVYLGLLRKAVDCEEITLASEFGIFQDYAVFKKFGTSSDDDLIVDLSNLINFELFNRFCADVQTQVPSDNKLSWVRKPSDYTSYGQNVPEVYRKLAQMDGAIHQAAGRGQANVLIAGTNAAADLESLEGFQSIETDTIGARLSGKIRNRSVIVNPGIDPDRIIGLYKGQSGLDGAGFTATYMPLTISDLLPGSGGNNVKRERIAATWATSGVAVPEFTAELDITETA